MDQSKFVKSYLGNNWKIKSEVRSKLELSEEEMKAVPMSVISHIIIGESFGFARLKKVIQKVGAIESFIIGPGYLKTIHLAIKPANEYERVIKPNTKINISGETESLYNSIRKKFKIYVNKMVEIEKIEKEKIEKREN